MDENQTPHGPLPDPTDLAPATLLTRDLCLDPQATIIICIKLLPQNSSHIWRFLCTLCTVQPQTHRHHTQAAYLLLQKNLQQTTQIAAMPLGLLHAADTGVSLLLVSLICGWQHLSQDIQPLWEMLTSVRSMVYLNQYAVTSSANRWAHRTLESGWATHLELPQQLHSPSWGCQRAYL